MPSYSTPYVHLNTSEAENFLVKSRESTGAGRHEPFKGLIILCPDAIAAREIAIHGTSISTSHGPGFEQVAIDTLKWCLGVGGTISMCVDQVPDFQELHDGFEVVLHPHADPKSETVMAALAKFEAVTRLPARQPVIWVCASRGDYDTAVSAGDIPADIPAWPDGSGPNNVINRQHDDLDVVLIDGEGRSVWPLTGKEMGSIPARLALVGEKPSEDLLDGIAQDIDEHIIPRQSAPTL